MKCPHGGCEREWCFDCDPANAVALYEERAAIMEYLGNQTREEAERNARKDIEEMRKHATTER